MSISEAYYQLQADQNVRIQDAAVRDDLLILQDSLDPKLAGLVPRVDVLRRPPLRPVTKRPDPGPRRSSHREAAVACAEPASHGHAERQRPDAVMPCGP